jgi:hypothetical protein
MCKKGDEITPFDGNLQKKERYGKPGVRIKRKT